MTKYMKKPIPVDAWQIDLLEMQNAGSYPDWVNTAWVNNKIEPNYSTNELAINTLEGKMVATEGDYLIMGPLGEFWFNKRVIFQEMYEEVKN